MSRSSTAYTLFPQSVFVFLTLLFVLADKNPMAALMGLCAIIAALNTIILNQRKIEQEIIKK